MEGAIVLGRILSTGATDLRVCNSDIGGEIAATGSTGLVTIGDPNEDCAGNTILAIVVLNNNTDGVEVADNVIYGVLTITGTTGSLPSPETGSVYTTNSGHAWSYGNGVLGQPCDGDGDWLGI